MMMYSQWNAYLIKKFFYESHDGDVITLRVSQEWFDRVAAMDGMGGYYDFLECMAKPCDLIVCGDRTDVCANMMAMLDRQRRCPGSEPWYVAYLALLCLPWTKTEGWGNYYDYLPQPLNGPRINYTDQIRQSIAHLVDRRGVDTRNDIFHWLKVWSDGRRSCEQRSVKGVFCYCPAHQKEDNRTGYFLSQVFFTNQLIARLPEIFHMTPRGRYLDYQGLSQFCTENQNRFPMSTQNIISSDEIGTGCEHLKEGLVGALYEYYQDWVEGGRRYEPRQVHAARGQGGEHVPCYRPNPIVRLAINLTNDGFDKIVIVTKEDMANRPSNLDLERLVVGGECAKGRWLPSGALKVVGVGCSRDAIWDRLAAADPNDDNWHNDTFAFCRSKCFVLMRVRAGSLLLVQHDAPPDGLPCYLLFKEEYRGNIERWIRMHQINTSSSLQCNGWNLIGVDSITQGALSQLPDGVHGGDDNPDRGFATVVRLAGGMRAERDGVYRTYFRDYLPEIEAYLPGDATRYKISISTSPASNAHVEEVPICGIDSCQEIIGDVFSWRNFEIVLSTDADVYQVKVDVELDGRPFGKSHTIRLHERGQECLSVANRTMDKYGEISSANSYWPTLEGAAVVGQMTNEEVDEEFDLDVWETYWRFVENFAGRSRHGMSGGDFFTLLSSCFTGEAWRKRILQMSYLCALDIYTNKEGVWSKFYPVPEALSVLPERSPVGGVRAILLGSFNRARVQACFDKTQTNGVSVHVYGQRISFDGNVTFSFMLPPRVVVEAASLEQLRSFAQECGLPLLAGLPNAYAQKSASVFDWYNCVRSDNCPGRRLGNPSDDDVTSWYQFLDYKMTVRDENGRLDNPLNQCQDLFKSCMCTMPMPYSSRLYYDLVLKREGVTVSVKDRSWAKWNSYRIDPTFGVKFSLAYRDTDGAIILPDELKLPKILARAAVLCSGRVPLEVATSAPYDRMLSGGSEYGLSIRPYHGRCQLIRGVPRAIAAQIASRLDAVLKDC